MTSPAAHSPATATSGATPCGTNASTGGSNRAQPPSPASHPTAIAAAIGCAGAADPVARSDERGRRFDSAGPLTIVHRLSQERGRFAPASVRLCDGWPYWDNNNLTRIRLI